MMDGLSSVCLVMPFLKIMDEPPFESAGEVIDFVDQITEVR